MRIFWIFLFSAIFGIFASPAHASIAIINSTSTYGADYIVHATTTISSINEVILVWTGTYDYDVRNATLYDSLGTQFFQVSSTYGTTPDTLEHGIWWYGVTTSTGDDQVTLDLGFNKYFGISIAVLDDVDTANLFNIVGDYVLGDEVDTLTSNILTSTYNGIMLASIHEDTDSGTYNFTPNDGLVTYEQNTDGFNMPFNSAYKFISVGTYTASFNSDLASGLALHTILVPGIGTSTSPTSTWQLPTSTPTFEYLINNYGNAMITIGASVLLVSFFGMVFTVFKRLV